VKTIRSRLIVMFVICLSFMAVLAVFYNQRIFDLKRKVILIEHLDDFRDNLLELRRHEKNFFLAKDVTSLDKMIFYLEQTEIGFSNLSSQVKNIMEKKQFDEYKTVLEDYKKMLQENISLTEAGSERYNNSTLRETGKILNDFSNTLISAKRRRIDKTLKQMFIIPIVLSGIFIIIFIFILRIAQNDIFEPLSLLQSATENISNGIFEPVKYTSQKCDEVSQCLVAFNKMTHEIETRQTQLLQSRKMASIGTFTSGIAHELNNPINNISLIVDTLQEDGKDMSFKERLSLYNDLMDQADRSTEIVKSLLEFSRTDQEHLEKISLEELVDKTARLVKNEMQIQQIKFKKKITGKLLPVWIDKSRLQQALLNLLINGIQAMPGGGTLSIILGPVGNLGEMRIDVTDTGIGIPADQLESIFDPFFTTKKEGEGTGLGLSVTYGIIQKHGGRILVKSKPGQGTCFSIFLNTRTSNESE
jgi:signal transduction histidine kinase